jgi:hypothetical protein
LFFTAGLAMTMIIAWRFDAARTVSPFLRYADPSFGDSISAAERMLWDSGIPGTGAGTYQAILPIYQISNLAQAPTAAAAFAIQLGWPMAVFSVALAVTIVFLLVRGALMRRRDSFYSTAAAACIASALTEAFCDASLLNPGIATLLAIITGLGFAQSVGRNDNP